MTHYEIGGEHLAKLKTYQQYALPAGTKLQPMRPEDLFYVDQIVGTPDECIRRIEHVKNQYGCEELIMQVIYGGMPRGRRREEHPAVRTRSRAGRPRDGRRRHG